jgi:CubicO group peptidase (beta-lactamase class C family)
MKNTYTRPFLAFLLAISFISFSLPLAAHAQTGTAAVQTAAPSYEKALAEIESKTEARRKELGIPGMALVIVKDDQIIFMKGLGYKDFENKVAVTPDTQFAIGSATKAFTALSVLMTADEGKLSLEDSPKKLLPYFKMYDPDTDKNITIRDLLSHSSGLNRTDLAMITGKLTRAELIEVAAQAKPTAKLREKFQYQNIMFAAAGELVTQAQKQAWEKFVPERIFKPLGMTNTTMSIKQMEKAKDHSLGYSYNFDTKETEKLPFREIDQVAPAGSINSSARDMAEWLRFVLNAGSVGGKRLVSEKGFDQWLKPQMKMNAAGTANYGLGWFLQNWNGLKVVQHGGNIDGFNSMVAMIPEKKLGFVMLTNVSGSSLGGELMPIVWSNILGEPAKSGAAAVSGTEKEAGKYKFEAAGFDMDVQFKDGKLIAVVPGQPVYTLENVGGRRYKLAGAPDGFFVTFKDTELFLEQPQGNYTLPRRKAEATVEARPVGDPASLKELIGRYELVENNLGAEVKEVDGKVSFAVTGQAAYPLVEKAKDSYGFTGLPDSFTIRLKRDAAGKVIALVTDQPGATVEWKRLAGDPKVTITVDELQKKVIEASGGEAAWRKFTSRVVESDIDLENQGVKGKAISYSRAPNKSATETTMTALGKTIATGWEYFDGTVGEQAYSFAPAEKYAGKLLEDARLSADFYGMLDWKSKYKKIEVTGTAKVGDEDVYIVSFEPEKGTAFKEYYSTKTFLLLKREGIVPSSTSSQSLPYTVTYSDYRDIDGVKMPFRTVNNSISNGNIVNVVKSVKHNVPVDDKLFAPRKKQ